MLTKSLSGAARLGWRDSLYWALIAVEPTVGVVATGDTQASMQSNVVTSHRACRGGTKLSCWVKTLLDLGALLSRGDSV
jgi:hypothetical protein